MYAEKLCLSHPCAEFWELWGELLSNYKPIKWGFSAKQTSTNDRCLLSFLLVSQQGESQRRLYRELLRNYNRLERPVVNDSQPLVVELQLSLLQIIDVVSYLLFCSLPILHNKSDLLCRDHILPLKQAIRGESRLSLAKHPP